MDSGCSRHLTGNDRWFFSLTPTRHKEYIVFGDNGKGKVCGVGVVRVSDCFTLREVALVSNLGFNLLLISQLLDEGFEVRFKEGCSWVLDSRGDLVCWIVPRDRVFLVDFSGTPFGPSCYLVVSPSSDLWKWHRRLGHLSFVLLSRLSSLDLSEDCPGLNLRRIWFVTRVVTGRWLLLLIHLLIR
jgi:hypothetical protein